MSVGLIISNKLDFTSCADKDGFHKSSHIWAKQWFPMISVWDDPYTYGLPVCIWAKHLTWDGTCTNKPAVASWLASVFASSSCETKHSYLTI